MMGVHTSPAPRGFTLLELMMSLTIMSILLGGMTSAVLLASHAIPDEEDLCEPTAQAGEGAEQIAGDLALAGSITEALTRSIEFTVPDRGHGAPGPETLRYAWSGTPGEPLTREYNGGSTTVVCDDVRAFSLEYGRKALPLDRAPHVLLVVKDDVTLTDQDQVRRDLMTSWGFTVLVRADDRTDDEIFGDARACDVMYISEEVWSPELDYRMRNGGYGIVNEEKWLHAAIGFAPGFYNDWGADIRLVDVDHEITSGFPTGWLTIFQSQQPVYGSGFPFTSGGRRLATQGSYTTFGVVDAGRALYDGQPARGRRVMLPWGDDDFDINALNDDGRMLMRRAIVWAAAPVGVSGVRITLQCGPDTQGRVETHARLLNVPGESP